jgi:hypothetical protein
LIGLGNWMPSWTRRSDNNMVRFQSEWGRVVRAHVEINARADDFIPEPAAFH